jgi:hypothetical protein
MNQENGPLEAKPEAACPASPVAPAHAILDNLPYALMVILGAVICQTTIPGPSLGWLAAGGYLAYGLAGALWVMLFVCPYCHFYDTRLCPCGYGQIAARLRARQPGDRFRAQFRKHIPVIAPLWFLPLIPGGLALARHFSWPLLGLLLAFAVDAFAILPLVSRLYGCARCPQKSACPWMGCREK